MSGKYSGNKIRRRRERWNEMAAEAAARQVRAEGRVQPRRHPVRAAGWVIGAVVGVAAGTGIALQAQAWQESREAADREARLAVFGDREDVPGPVDTVDVLLEQDRLVVVDPALESRVPEADRERAEAILAESPVPARIAYLREPIGTDLGYTSSGIGPQWWTSVGEEGHYVVIWENGSTDTGALGIEEEYLETRTKGQPGPALVRAAAEMATWEAVPLPTEPDEPYDNDYWGGIGGGIAAAGLAGAFIVTPLFLALRALVGARRRKAA